MTALLVDRDRFVSRYATEAVSGLCLCWFVRTRRSGGAPVC